MLYALLCTDKPDHLQVRLDTRAAHLDYLNGLGDQTEICRAIPR